MIILASKLLFVKGIKFLLSNKREKISLFSLVQVMSKLGQIKKKYNVKIGFSCIFCRFHSTFSSLHSTSAYIYKRYILSLGVNE